MRHRKLELTVGGLILVVVACIVHQTRAQQSLDTAVSALAAGRMRLEITNNFSVPITALAVVGTRTWTAKSETVRSVRFFDSLLNPERHAIQPGQSYSFTVFGPDPPPDQLTRELRLEAALFADGSTWGDHDWAKLLALRRSSAYKFNSEALAAINAAIVAGSSPSDLAKTLQQLRTSEMATATTAAEKQMADFAFEEPLTSLNASLRSGSEDSVSALTKLARARLQLRVNRIEAARPSKTD